MIYGDPKGCVFILGVCVCMSALDRHTPHAGQRNYGEACREVPLLWLLLPKEQQWLSAAHLGPPGCDTPLPLIQTLICVETRQGPSVSVRTVFQCLITASSEPPSVSPPPGCPPGGWSRLETQCRCCGWKLACWSSYWWNDENANKHKTATSIGRSCVHCLFFPFKTVFLLQWSLVLCKTYSVCWMFVSLEMWYK